MALIPKNNLRIEALFGDTNGRKLALKELSTTYQERLKTKIEDLEIDIKRVGKHALVIGGTITAVYLLLELMLPDDEPEVNTLDRQVSRPIVIEQRSQSSSWVTKTITSFALSWALEAARQKLMEFLATQQSTNDVKDTNDTTA